MIDSPSPKTIVRCPLARSKVTLRAESWTGGAATPREAVEDYRLAASRRSELDRQAGDKAKTGVFTGTFAQNPVTGDPLPVFVADYVLMGYGTGAIMAVPAQDERDWEFAGVFDLPIVRTVAPPEGWEGDAYTGDGPAINSANDALSLDGLDVDAAKARIIAWLEADAPRVNCPVHGPTVRAVPWARHAAGHTVVFDEQVAWLATQCSKTAVTELMRIAWRTVGAIITRVWADTEKLHDRFDGLRRIGIDEISYKRGHRYLTVVVDHDSGRLVWAAPGRDKATLGLFFDALGEQRCAQITHVSADGADWISGVVAERCPNAVRCADPFHVVRWATDALDEVRRAAWNQARGAVTQRRAGRASGHAKALKHARYALWKNPENLTTRQQAKLAWVAKTDPRLHRAYLHIRCIFYFLWIYSDQAPST